MKSQNASELRDCSGTESGSKFPGLSLMLVIAAEQSAWT